MFFHVPCDGNDLTYIACIADHSLHDIGDCLGFDTPQIRSIQLDSAYRELRDKIYKLLQEWRERDKGNATWGNAIKCFENLQNNQKLVTHIQEYLQQKRYPTGGQACLVYCV